MTSNDPKNIVKLTTEYHENRTDPSSEMIVKAINYPPAYPDNKQKEKCNTKDEKHENCHPMHCHNIQPMQSATIAISIDKTSDDDQQDSKK